MQERQWHESLGDDGRQRTSVSGPLWIRDVLTKMSTQGTPLPCPPLPVLFDRLVPVHWGFALLINHSLSIRQRQWRAHDRMSCVADHGWPHRRVLRSVTPHHCVYRRIRIWRKESYRYWTCYHINKKNRYFLSLEELKTKKLASNFHLGIIIWDGVRILGQRRFNEFLLRDQEAENTVVVRHASSCQLSYHSKKY